MDALEKFQKINGLANVSSLLMFPATRAYLKELLEAEEKAAREKKRGMTDEEWGRVNNEISIACQKERELFGSFEAATRDINNLIALSSPLEIQTRPKHSKKRGRKTTW